MKRNFIMKTMSPELFPAIAAFAEVARHASFTKAAAQLGVLASALSQTVRTLEERLGVRLLDRSTRRVGLTEMGRQFLDAALPGLALLAWLLPSAPLALPAPTIDIHFSSAQARLPRQPRAPPLLA